MFHLQPTRTVRSTLWAVSFCVYTRKILVRTDCTTGTRKHENAKHCGRWGRASAKKSTRRQTAPTGCCGKRAVSSWPIFCVIKTGGGLQERKLGHLSAILGVGCKLRYKDSGTRRPIRRYGGVLVFVPLQGTTTNNRPAPQQGTNVTKFYCFYLFILPIFFQSILKDFFLAGYNLIQSEGEW